MSLLTSLPTGEDGRKVRRPGRVASVTERPERLGSGAAKAEAGAAWNSP